MVAGAGSLLQPRVGIVPLFQCQQVPAAKIPPAPIISIPKSKVADLHRTRDPGRQPEDDEENVQAGDGPVVVDAGEAMRGEQYVENDQDGRASLDDAASLGICQGKEREGKERENKHTTKRSKLAPEYAINVTTKPARPRIASAMMSCRIRRPLTPLLGWSTWPVTMSWLSVPGRLFCACAMWS